jgi:hypothetical protein
MATEKVVKKAQVGFVLSLIAGIIILINAVMFVALADFLDLVGAVIPAFVGDIFAGLAVVGVVFAAIVIIGAILIYIPGKETIGGILVIIFSIFSIIVGGGFILGLVLGVIGGVLGLRKK